MHRFFIFALILPLLLALIGPKIAYSAVLSTDGSPTPSQSQNSALAPQTESIKQGAQNLMNKAQNELQQGATKAVDTANQALKDEISSVKLAAYSTGTHASTLATVKTEQSLEMVRLLPNLSNALKYKLRIRRLKILLFALDRF